MHTLFFRACGITKEVRLSCAVDVTDLFPIGDFEFRFGMRARAPAEFFRRSAANEHILAERRRWLRDDAAAYLALLPHGEPLLEEAAALFVEWQIIPEPRWAAEPFECFRNLGMQVEADLVLLMRGDSGEMEIAGGCVCFPTAWRLADKLGRPMSFVHEPVPGLNTRLGPPIATALAKLRPGTAWWRNNWSLTASAELNQHPDRGLPKLTPASRLDSVWLRVERQALIALPQTGGVLFAICLESETLAALKGEAPEAMKSLAHALQTMPEEVAAYKGLAMARESLIEQLTTIW